MREKGVHIWDLFPCFLTAAHSYDDIEFIAEKFEESVQELINAGFLNLQNLSPTKLDTIKRASKPPIAGAKLGMDAEGKPAWFINDFENPGTYLKVLEAIA
jgi:hypothetical protein